MTTERDDQLEERVDRLRVRSSLFAELDGHALEQLLMAAREVVIPPGYTVIPTLWPGEDLYLVTKGSLAYGAHDLHARAGVLVAVGGPCPGAGLPYLLIALTEVELLEIPGPRVDEITALLPFLTDGEPRLLTLPVEEETDQDEDSDLRPLRGETLI